jgi:MFS family permease
MLRQALPASREARRILVGTLFSAVGRGLTLPFLFVYLSEVRGIGAGTVGLLVGWMGAVSLVLAPVGGSLVDRFGARRVVLPLLGVQALGTASLAVVDSTASAFVVLTVIAIGLSTIWPGQTTILASLVDDHERQRVFGLSFTLLNLGIGIGGVIAGALVDASRPVTFQMLYVADGISYLAPALILLSLPQVGQAVTGEHGDRERPPGGYAEVFRDRTFVRVFLFGLVLITFGYAQIEVGFTAFATTVADVPTGVLGLAFAGNTLVIVVAQLFVVRWLDGRSRTRALALAAMIFAVSWVFLAGAGLAGSGLGGAAGPALAVTGVIACTVVFALGETLMSPVMPAMINALATDELRGRYNALGGMTWGLSGIVGPVAAGPLIGGGHAYTWVLLVVFGCLSAAAFALMLHRRLTPAQDGRAPVALDAAPTSPAAAASAPAAPAASASASSASAAPAVAE